MAGDILKIDLVSQAFMRNPFATLARLRQAGPVVRVKLPLLGKTSLATTHEVVNEVLKDDQTCVRDARNAGKRTAVGFRWWAWLPRSVRLLNENMRSHDGPDHRRLRKLVDQAFSRHGALGMRPRIAATCDGLLQHRRHDHRHRPHDSTSVRENSPPLPPRRRPRALPNRRPGNSSWLP
jgi:cytochrome P450